MNVYDFTVKKTTGELQPLSEYKGQVALIVNTATKCGFSPQFKELEQLYQTYKKEGFTVLGFPCNQFLKQEPVSNEQMIDVCKRDYGVTFPLFAKINVNGKEAHPLYTHLKEEKNGAFGGAIKWNFTKFLINQNGEVIQRYGPNVTPMKIEEDIREWLGQGHTGE